jgi:hypothetical protein
MMIKLFFVLMFMHPVVRCENGEPSIGFVKKSVSRTSIMTDENGWRLKQFPDPINGSHIQEYQIVKIRDTGWQPQWEPEPNRELQ